MPKFIKFIAVVTVLLWGWLTFLINKTMPSSYTSIFLFLSVLFLALSFSFSFPFYVIYKKRLPNFTNLKLLYRKSLKWGMFISFGVVGIAFLKALNLINLLNAGLFALLWVGIFFQIKGKK